MVYYGQRMQGKTSGSGEASGGTTVRPQLSSPRGLVSTTDSLGDDVWWQGRTAHWGGSAGPASRLRVRVGQAWGACPADLSFLILGLLRGHTNTAWFKAPATHESRCSQKLLYPRSLVNRDTHETEHSKGWVHPRSQGFPGRCRVDTRVILYCTSLQTLSLFYCIFREPTLSLIL